MCYCAASHWACLVAVPAQVKRRPAGALPGPQHITTISTSREGSSACCRVGDMIKFGQSTRDWLLCSPAELMPEEGPSKTQRLEARLLKVPGSRLLYNLVTSLTPLNQLQQA
jgi:hypothetical protein